MTKYVAQVKKVLKDIKVAEASLKVCTVKSTI